MSDKTKELRIFKSVMYTQEAADGNPEMAKIIEAKTDIKPGGQTDYWSMPGMRVVAAAQTADGRKIEVPLALPAFQIKGADTIQKAFKQIDYYMNVAVSAELARKKMVAQETHDMLQHEDAKAKAAGAGMALSKGGLLLPKGALGAEVVRAIPPVDGEAKAVREGLKP